MTTPIECDSCGGPIDKDEAIVMSDGDGELFYFCCEECVESEESAVPDRELERVLSPEI
jgi:YHS domain-containing protein